jgi:hypothetical protein
MPDNLRAVLDEMDNWIAKCGVDELGTVKAADIIRWRASLAIALERLDKLGQASQSALDAYLLRSSTSAFPSSSSSRSTASARQKHMRRFASAMATLERELAGIPDEQASS